VDIRQLRYFVAVVESESFSRAAQKLHVAQPALSLHVRNMEADLGTELLVRTPQGVIPTDAGLVLLHRAREIIADFQSARQAVQEHANDPAGEVQIGLPGTIAEMLAVPLILRARERYPRIRLKIAEAMSGFVLEWLYESRIDLGVLYLPIHERGLRSTPIATEQLYLFAPSDFESEHLPEDGVLNDLTVIPELPLILPGPSHGLRSLIDAELERHGLALTTVTEVNSYKAIKTLVQHGEGVSILPANAITEEVADGDVRSWSFGDPPFARTVHLVQPFDRRLTSAALAVQDLCRATLEDLRATGHWLTSLDETPVRRAPRADSDD
jgi:LysR family nitrogen assimilation transcriptional regulator